MDSFLHWLLCAKEDWFKHTLHIYLEALERAGARARQRAMQGASCCIESLQSKIAGGFLWLNVHIGAACWV